MAGRGEGQASRLQLSPVAVGQDSQKHLAFQVRHQWVPVDIKVPGVTAGLSMLQKVPPPRVGVARRRHVVGYDVHQQLLAMGLERACEATESGLTAELLIDPVRIDDVVSVEASGSSLEEGRTVDVADPQRRQVSGAGGRRVKREIPGELQPVGAARRCVRHARRWRQTLCRPWPR